MSHRRNAVSGKQLIAKLGTDEYELSYLILKHNLTVLNPPKIPFLKAILKPRYLRADSKEFLEIIRNDPSRLRQKLFLQAEVEKISTKESLPSPPETGSRVRDSLDALLDFEAEPSTPEEVDSESSTPAEKPARYSLGEDASKARSLPKEAKTALGITEESLLKGAIEEHESEIKNSPNVFSLIGKVWFIKFQNQEWGLYPDQKKYKYIASLLSLSNNSPEKDDLEYSIHNLDLMSKVEGKDVREEYPSDELDDWNVSDLSGELTPENLENFKETGYRLLESLKEVKKSNDQNLIDSAQEKLDKYRSHLLNTYGIKILISEDQSRISYRVLHRASEEDEKVRQLVKNHIYNAIKDFKDYMPMFGRHLRHSLKTKLYETIYSPENYIPWHVSV